MGYVSFLIGASVGPGNIHAIFGLPPVPAFKAEAQQMAPGVLESGPCGSNRDDFRLRMNSLWGTVGWFSQQVDRSP